MLFNLPNDTECELTTFVGRVQKSGPNDVPAVSFRLRLASVTNTLLDLFSPTIRLTVYAPVEGQEQLPGMEVVTPILRSKDLKHWAPKTTLEGWKVIVARGITEGSALQMSKCKVDDFRFDFFEGGHMDVECRVSTADVDEAGAGMLWGRQKRKVFVTIIAPEMPGKAIDGSVEAFKADHPDMFEETNPEPDPVARDAEQAFAESVEGEAGPGTGSSDDAGGEGGSDSEGGETDIGADVAAFEEGLQRSAAAAGLAPKGRRGRARLAAVE